MNADTAAHDRELGLAWSLTDWPAIRQRCDAMLAERDYLNIPKPTMPPRGRPKGARIGAVHRRRGGQPVRRGPDHVWRNGNGKRPKPTKPSKPKPRDPKTGRFVEWADHGR